MLFRSAGQEIHPPYDSRILELCTGSKGLLKTAAHTLDYQFGFKVSETWFYKFLEKAIAPLILFQLISLYLLNCIVVVHPENNAIIERFGHPLKQVLKPGIHFKMPWPVDSVYYYPVEKILKLHLDKHMLKDEKDEDSHGHGHGHGRKKKKKVKHKALLFTKEHGHEEQYFLVPKLTNNQKSKNIPVNLVNIDFIIHYKINNIFDYSYQHKSPENLLRVLSYQNLTKFLVSTPIQNLLVNKRLDICKKLQKNIQKSCNSHKLGIQILLTAICNVHPPISVAGDFEAVIGAMEEKKTKILSAQKYRNKILPIAQAEAFKIVRKAETYFQKREKISKARANAFKNFIKAFEQGKEVYLTYKYLKVLEEHLAKHRIYINGISGLTKEVNIINLEDQLRTLHDLDLGKEENK